VDNDGSTVLSVDQLAREAVDFIVGTPDLYCANCPATSPTKRRSV
jgi:hypothetical protein